MEILGKLFGSPARIKIMRLFLLNPDGAFENKDIANRSRVSPEITRKEISMLSGIGFIKKNKNGWILNSSFVYLEQIEILLTGTYTLNKEAILEMTKKAGKIKLLIASGTFIKNKDSRVDLLIVGDKIKRKVIEDGLKRMEAEIGKELTYALFDTAEFLYRFNMYDKLVLDILDFPHEVIVEVKELSTQVLKKN
ncbi:MAG: hypothetical protein NTW62_00555 [Candidatus Nomurabacteria bacterium]|nr:hypothetical protein [Candidatus Nomurabacteria bacterium]